jgi:hypothetical protein
MDIDKSVMKKRPRDQAVETKAASDKNIVRSSSPNNDADSDSRQIKRPRTGTMNPPEKSSQKNTVKSVKLTLSNKPVTFKSQEIIDLTDDYVSEIDIGTIVTPP